MKRILPGAAMAAALFSGLPAFGQTYQDSGGTIVRGMVPITPGVGPLFTASNPGKISGSFSASLGGFQPTPAYSQLSVGATSTRVTLPNGSVVVVYQHRLITAFVTLGNSTVTATTAGDVIPAGGWMAFTVGPNNTLAAIGDSRRDYAQSLWGSGSADWRRRRWKRRRRRLQSVGRSGTGSTAPGSATYNGMSSPAVTWSARPAQRGDRRQPDSTCLASTPMFCPPLCLRALPQQPIRKSRRRA